MNEIKRKWKSIDESVKRFNKTGEEFYRYTVTPDMTRDVFELIAEVERYRYAFESIVNIDGMYLDREFDFEDAYLTIDDIAKEALRGGEEI